MINEKAYEIIEESLRTAGLDPNAFDILADEPVALTSMADPDQELPCVAAVSKTNGMILLFACRPVEEAEVEEKSLIIQ